MKKKANVRKGEPGTGPKKKHAARLWHAEKVRRTYESVGTEKEKKFVAGREGAAPFRPTTKKKKKKKKKKKEKKKKKIVGPATVGWHQSSAGIAKNGLKKILQGRRKVGPSKEKQTMPKGRPNRRPPGVSKSWIHCKLRQQRAVSREGRKMAAKKKRHVAAKKSEREMACGSREADETKKEKRGMAGGLTKPAEKRNLSVGPGIVPTPPTKRGLGGKIGGAIKGDNKKMGGKVRKGEALLIQQKVVATI